MATATKNIKKPTPVTKAVKKPAPVTKAVQKTAPVAKAVKKPAPVAKAVQKPAAAPKSVKKPAVATKPVTKAVPAKKAAPAKKAVPAKKAAAPVANASAVIKPVKEAFTKAALVEHLATQSGVEPKGVKAVLAALEVTVLGAVHKKGHGEFTLPGLLKIGVQKIEAKKKRFGKDPFSGQDRWFPAKPASVRIKARALKKLKDAAA